MYGQMHTLIILTGISANGGGPKDLGKLEYGVGLKVNNFRGMGETLLLNYRAWELYKN